MCGHRQPLNQCLISSDIRNAKRHHRNTHGLHSTVFNLQLASFHKER